jgi:hypothetical protein
MEARAAVSDVAVQGGEVDRDREVRNRTGHGILPRGFLIDDQSDVAEGRTGQSQPRSRKSACKVAAGSYAVASSRMCPSTAQ